MAKYSDLYLQNFNFYLLNVNLISRLEARQKGIGDALVAFQKSQGNGQLCGKGQMVSQEGEEDEEIGEELANWYRKKRLGSRQTSITTEPLSQSSPNRRRARLFGGSLEEYVESTGEAIPLVVTSCIRVLSRFALHHQGVFRVSGSQVEINNFREAFEMGEDPLRNVQDGSDVNSIAGVLKLYLRGLRGRSCMIDPRCR
jgi:SLIT-ROBO Rho GTPase activating protein